MPLAVITGGAKRIGKAIAEHLAMQGFDLALHYNQSTEQAHQLKDELEKKAATKVSLFQADLADQADVESMCQQISQHCGEIDLLINNASMFQYDAPSSFSPKLALECFQVNTLSPIVLSRHFYQQANPFVIINILDNKVVSPTYDYFSYGLSKTSLHYATLAMAMEFSPKARVCAIAPGITLPSGDQTIEEFQQAWRQNPLGHGSTLEDICKTIDLLYQSNSINGQTITVDGGESLTKPLRDVAFRDD